MSHSVDHTSIGMAVATIMLQVISEATKSDAGFIIASIMGISTIVYNLIKILQLLKRKK